MEINKKILSIPPYLSTSWTNVSSLYVKEKNSKPVLMVATKSGSVIEVPNVSEGLINQAFQAHAEFLKNPERDLQQNTAPSNPSIGIKVPFLGADFAQFNSIMQHDSNHMHAAPIPKEMLDKIAHIAQAVGIDLSVFPKPEPHCNCPHCQVARAIHNVEETEIEEEEPITEEDLTFRDWEIEQANDKLYIVTNPLNEEEHYQVFLGSPLGCTCGKSHCEHIRAVLQT